MIKTENLTKKYGDMFAIKGIELDLEQGDLFGFIGPNGAGKTCLLYTSPSPRDQRGSRMPSSA